MIEFLNSLKQDKQKLTALVIVTAVFLYVDFSFVLKAQVKGNTDAKTKVDKLYGEILAVKRDLATMQQAQAKQSGKVKAKKIVSEGELLSLVEHISVTAKNNDVRVTQINPSKGQRQNAEGQAAAYIPVFIKLDLTSGYHNLGAFLNQLENSEYAIATEDIRINPDPADPQRERVVVTLRTYVKA